MAAPIWLLLLPLLLLGGLAAIVVLVVLAIVNNRLGTVAAIGGLLLLLLGGGLMLSVIGYRSATFVPEGGSFHVGPAGFGGNFQSNFDFNEARQPQNVNWRVSWFGLLFLVAIPLMLLLALFRRVASPRSAGQRCGRIGWVPAVLALVLLGFVGLACLKWLSSARHFAHARQQEMVMRQAADMRAQLLRHVEVQREAAVTTNMVHDQIAAMEIHELMDKVDAPRIPLPPPAAPTAPQAPEPAAAVAVVAEASQASAAAEPAAEAPADKPQEDPVDAGLAAEVKAALAVITGDDEESSGEAASAAAESTDTSTSAASDDPQPADAASAQPSAAATDHTHDAKDAADSSQSEAEAEAAEDSKAPADATISNDKHKTDDAEPAVAETKTAESSSPAAAEPAESEAPAPAMDMAAAQISDEPRPAWVDRPAKRTGEVWREVVETEEYADANECYAAANVYLLIKTYEHLQMLVGEQSYVEELPSITFSGPSILANGRLISHDRGKTLGWGDGRLNLMKSLDLGVDYIRREIVPDDGEYMETVARSFGPMKKLYTQMEFTPGVDRELRGRWEAHEREERLATVGFGAGGILGLLGMAYGLLKVDTWTKGYYTKRLFLGVPAAIIGLASLFAFLVS